jgi:hypothetical protein
MTFELSPQHVEVRNKARALAQTINAEEIDRTGAVPADVALDVVATASGDSLALVVTVEEIAAASAAAAAAAAAAQGGRVMSLTGLRGASEIEASPRGQLVLAAMALGVGKAATDAALSEIRRSNATPGADVEKPHWVVADVATDLDAARLLTYKAARTGSAADAAIARLMAATAATRAVDAAVRLTGPAALTSGNVIERLSRDVRAVTVLLGTEEDQRAMAAEGLLPH